MKADQCNVIYVYVHDVLVCAGLVCVVVAGAVMCVCICAWCIDSIIYSCMY